MRDLTDIAVFRDRLLYLSGGEVQTTLLHRLVYLIGEEKSITPGFSLGDMKKNYNGFWRHFCPARSLDIYGKVDLQK